MRALSRAGLGFRVLPVKNVGHQDRIRSRIAEGVKAMNLAMRCLLREVIQSKFQCRVVYPFLRLTNRVNGRPNVRD